MAIDYSEQVSLTTQIILSHDDNQTKIVTTANKIITLISFDKGDTLECIYTARIEAWTVYDWTRIRNVHSNHHLMMTG